MKREWQIVESPHDEGPVKAIIRSRFRVGELMRKHPGINFKFEAMPFTDLTFLVVVTFMRH